MLTRLHIKNYAIISELDFQLQKGLTILTGETGAGKSILIGALSMVLGKRADSSVLFKEDEKCVVEAYFQIDKYNLESFFTENDLDSENPTILRREINSNGKSRAFINDTPVNLTQLKSLASRLIDIHSQHEVLTLKSVDFRLRFLDSCADGETLIKEYKESYSAWSALKQQVDKLKESLQKASADEDYLNFQLQELEELNLQEGELQENQDKLSLLENAEEIGGTLSEISNLILNSDEAIVDNLRTSESELLKLSRKFPSAGTWAERIRQNLIDLEDVASEMHYQANSLEHDPSDQQRLAERVDEIIRLMTKHRIQSESEMIALQLELDSQLNSITNSDEELTLLNGRLEEADSKLHRLAEKLSLQRTDVAQRIAPVLTNELQELGMPDAQLIIELESADRNPSGHDKVNILFTANKGQSLQDISRIASGGELSRLMLSTKAEMARNTLLPVIIFDEVDTGVSGDVADKMGSKIKVLSNHMQVISITHLPQIASKADQHLHVYKEDKEGRTVTGIRDLDKSDRIVEIAKMLSNARPTKAALAHAKNLVEQKA
jgi:DNA repair protein RecN (Recombination protein N)